MGGNLFKPLGAERISKSKYQELESEIRLLFLENHITQHYFIKSVLEKESFGDIDILVTSEMKLSREKIQTIFNLKPEFVQKTSGGISFLYRNTQIDLIIVNRMNVDVSLLFYDWNDLGNMIGRLCKSFRCKLKPQGLYFTLYDSDIKSKKIGEYFLTSDVRTILEFVDLDHDQYLRGFPTFIHLFNFIIGSERFNRRYFDSTEFNNHNALKRDNKRKVFVDFINYLNEHNITDTFSERLPVNETIDFLDNKFDVNLKDRINKDIKRNELYKLIHSKWNGNLFMELTGLQGKELGTFIRNLNLKYPDKNFILGLTQEEINNLVIKEFKNEKN